MSVEMLSWVSLHSRLQRAFNRAIHQLAAEEKALLRIVTVSTVLVGGDNPMRLPFPALQPATWAQAARSLEQPRWAGVCSCAIPWLPMCAPEIRCVDNVRGHENCVNEAAVERSISRIGIDRSLPLPHRCLNAGEVEAEIQKDESDGPNQNLFGDSSHGAMEPLIIRSS